MLKTKLAPPRHVRPTVRRRGILNRLLDAAHLRLTVICAPAGYGKTTLAAQWRTELVAQGRKVAWFSLDAADNDPGAFVSGLGEVMASAGFGFAREACALYQADQPASLGEARDALINDMAANGEDLHLFLDDLHCLSNPEIKAFLSGLVSKAPENLHFVLISRAEPELSLAALNLHGEINRIGIDDLQLDHDEARSLVESRLQTPPDPDELQALLEATEGWATAIQWATIALARNRAFRWAPGSGHGRPALVQEAFLREIIEGLPENVQSFLLQTSILESFNAPLARAVTGQKDATEVIEQIERDNFPLLPLQGEAGWFRYHPLFHSFLRDMLMQRYIEETRARAEILARAAVRDGDRLSALLGEVGGARFDPFILHQRAAQWHGQAGLTEQAVHHYLAINDTDSILELLEDCTLSLLEKGRMNFLMGMVARLPEGTYANRPRLRLNLAWCQVLSCRTKEARRLLDGLEPDPAAEGGLHEEELNAVRRALKVFDDDTSGEIFRNPRWKGKGEPFHIAAGCNAVAFERLMAGDYAHARRIATWVEQQPDMSRLYFPHVYRQCMLALSHCYEGNFADADRISGQVLALAERRQGRRSAPASIAVAVLSENYYEQNRLSELCDLLSNRFDVINRTVFPDALIRAYVNGARAFWALNEPGRAADLLGLLFSYGEEKGFARVMGSSLAERIRQALDRDRMGEARGLMRDLEALSDIEALPTFDTGGELVLLARISRARLDLRTGKIDRALANLDELCRHYASTTRRRLQARLALLRAMARIKAGKSILAHEDFLHALTLGEKCGLVRTFLDKSWICDDLMKRFEGVMSLPPANRAFLDSLFADAPPPPIPPTQTARLARATAGAVGISARERQILALLVQGLPNKRIAMAMGVSVETVRWHLKNIYSKLDVGNRHDAATRARILNLV